MGSKNQEDTFDMAVCTLSEQDKSTVKKIHDIANVLGYVPKISPVGKKPGDWKCEYTAAKPKRVLFILRVTGSRFSLRCKFFHIPQYSNLLMDCSEHCITDLLSSSKDCENHGGGCDGPISFALEGKIYSKCRHSFMFKDVQPEDVDGIVKLIENEARLNARTSSY